MLVAPAGATSVALAQVVLALGGELTVMPVGSVSVNATPVSEKVMPPGSAFALFESVIWRCDTPAAGIVFGLNVLLTLICEGGTNTTLLDPVRFWMLSSVLATVILPAVNVPAVSEVTEYVIVHVSLKMKSGDVAV